MRDRLGFGGIGKHMFRIHANNIRSISKPKIVEGGFISPFEHWSHVDWVTLNCGEAIKWEQVQKSNCGCWRRQKHWMDLTFKRTSTACSTQTKFYCSITCRCDLHGARGRLIGNVTKSVYDGDLETILWAKYEGYCWWIDEDVLANLIFVVYGWIFRKPRNQFPVKAQLLKRDSPVSANRLKCPVNWERGIKS